MDEKPIENGNSSKSPDETHSRVSIINSVQTPLGFFVLVILIVEVILGITANFSSGEDRTYLIIGMIVLIFLLVILVTGLAIFRPSALYGKEIPVKKKSSAQRKKTSESRIVTISKPRILWASSFPDLASTNALKQEVTTIQQTFPKSKLKVEDNLTADGLREILTNNQFDIVQLTVNVTRDGSISFSHGSEQETIPGDGVVRLLEVSGTKLLILASCNSVPLASKLAMKINMIASTSNLGVEPFAKWQAIFYQLLAKGTSLSEAYSIGVSSVQVPLSIIFHEDVIFSK